MCFALSNIRAGSCESIVPNNNGGVPLNVRHVTNPVRPVIGRRWQHLFNVCECIRSSHGGEPLRVACRSIHLFQLPSKPLPTRPRIKTLHWKNFAMGRHGSRYCIAVKEGTRMETAKVCLWFVVHRATICTRYCQRCQHHFILCSQVDFCSLKDQEVTAKQATRMLNIT